GVVLVHRGGREDLAVPLRAEGADERRAAIAHRGDVAELALERERAPHRVAEEAQDVGEGADDGHGPGPANGYGREPAELGHVPARLRGWKRPDQSASCRRRARGRYLRWARISSMAWRMPLAMSVHARSSSSHWATGRASLGRAWSLPKGAPVQSQDRMMMGM